MEVGKNLSKTVSKHVLSLLVEDTPGALTRVSALFARRSFNIDSLAVGITDRLGYSRITVVVQADHAQLEQITKQLNKLVNVMKVVVMSPENSVFRDHLLVKVSCNRSNRSRILDLVDTFRARVVDLSPDTAIVEITGNTSKVSALLEMLHEFGILEVVQSGLVGIGRGPRALHSERRQRPSSNGIQK